MARRPIQKIAALFVEREGCYYGLPDIDPWDENRDARKYCGPYPVIAHPPCQRWGRMWFGQPLHVKRTGQRKKKGDDGGCFKHALSSVRKFGGIIEHPWGSHAWPHFKIKLPSRKGGWVKADEFGWTCCVEQGRYGHYARKPTLLYFVGKKKPPELRWGESKMRLDPRVIERMGLKRAKRLGEVGARGGGKDSSARIATPIEFRDLLIAIVKGETTMKKSSDRKSVKKKKLSADKPKKKINSRAKGKVGELELVNFLKERGIEARRGQQYEGSSDSPDVVAGGVLHNFHIEVKRVEAGNVYNWMAQANTDADLCKVPVVAHRKNGKQWLAIMDFREFLNIVQEIYNAKAALSQ